MQVCRIYTIPELYDGHSVLGYLDRTLVVVYIVPPRLDIADPVTFISTTNPM